VTPAVTEHHLLWWSRGTWLRAKVARRAARTAAQVAQLVEHFWTTGADCLPVVDAQGVRRGRPPLVLPLTSVRAKQGPGMDEERSSGSKCQKVYSTPYILLYGKISTVPRPEFCPHFARHRTHLHLGKRRFLIIFGCAQNA